MGSTMNNTERDRFELLSAYLDGEVTAVERQQVQQWLDNDPQVQQLHNRLLKLRQGIQTLPIPQAEQSPQQVEQQVFQRLERRRLRRIMLWSSGAIAAVFVGAVSSFLGGNNSLTPKLVQSPPPSSPEIASDSLMIAINQPVVKIPKAPIASPIENGDN